MNKEVEDDINELKNKAEELKRIFSSKLKNSE